MNDVLCSPAQAGAQEPRAASLSRCRAHVRLNWTPASAGELEFA